jgi:hypothetical protein
MTTTFHALEADPRVISTDQRDAAERTARYAAHQADQEEARRADKGCRTRGSGGRAGEAHRRA